MRREKGFTRRVLIIEVTPFQVDREDLVVCEFPIIKIYTFQLEMFLDGYLSRFMSRRCSKFSFF